MNNQQMNDPRFPQKPIYGPNAQQKPMYGPNVPVEPTYGPNAAINPAYSQQVYQDTTPLSPWAYAGYMLLFSLPLVGLIMMLIYAFGDGNINLKNFARGFLLLGLIGFVLGLIFGATLVNLFTELL